MSTNTAEVRLRSKLLSLRVRYNENEDEDRREAIRDPYVELVRDLPDTAQAAALASLSYCTEE